MIRAITLAAALSLAATGSWAQKIDANGRCHNAAGKMAKMNVCKPPAKVGAPNCKNGKACGNTCISMKDACHK